MYLLLQLPLDDTSESVQFVLNELPLYRTVYRVWQFIKL